MRSAKRRRRRSKVRSGRRQTQAPASIYDSIRQAPPVIRAGAAALAVMTVFVYFPALIGEPVWDDTIWSEEPLVLSWSGIREIWFEPSAIRQEAHYWPLVYTSFWLEHKLWGLAPLGYHLVNVLLHLANTLLAWRLLALLGVPGAWAAAAIFAVHPLHVESVAWIIERKDLLSTLFYFLAVLAWIGQARPRIALAAVFLTAALLSKSMAVTLPAALLLWYWWRGQWPPARAALGLGLLFGIALAITLADLAFYSSREPLDLGYTFIDRVQIASQALWFYFAKLLWPTNLAVIYPHFEVGADQLVAWAYVAGAAAVAALLWFGRHRFGRGPAVAAAFFVLTLAPSLGFIDYGYMQFSFVADRFQYLAGLGLIAAFVAAAVGITDRFTLHRHVAPTALGMALAILGGLAWSHAGIYRNGILFFEHIVAHNPEARYVYANLGTRYMDAGRLEEGIETILISTQKQPDDAGVFLNLGLARMELDQLPEAKQALRRALELDDSVRDIRHNMGEVLRRQGAHQAATEHFREAIEIDAEFASSHAGLGQSLFQLGRYEQAAASIDRAIELGLDPAQARTLNLSAAQGLGRLGRFEAAEARIAAVAAEVPGDARPAATRVAVRHEAGQVRAAARVLRAAIDLFAGDALALYRLGEALATLDVDEHALTAYRAVLAVDPDHAEALVGIGNLELELRSYAASLAAFERALELVPELSEQAALHRAMGEAAMELGLPDASAHFERALAIEPSEQSALDRLAMLHFNAERYEAAVALYLTMLESQPNNHTTHANVGLALHRLGRNAEALEHVRQALAINPENELAQGVLGLLNTAR